LALSAAFLLVAAGAGFAKDPPTRTVQGFVTAPDDSLVVGAVVYLKNTKSLQIRSFFTQKDGAYSFSRPQPRYRLRAQGRKSGHMEQPAHAQLLRRPQDHHHQSEAEPEEVGRGRTDHRLSWSVSV
jgi:hypothetical protein